MYYMYQPDSTASKQPAIELASSSRTFSEAGNVKTVSVPLA